MNKLSEYHVETVVRAIRLTQEINDLKLSQTFEMLAPIFGNELINAAKAVIFKKQI